MAFNFPFKRNLSDLKNSHEDTNVDYEFSKATNIFTSQRKKIGISLEDLSKKTKISKNVLIAIENGWKRYLPEPTYLISMIKRLEMELNLEKDSLKGLLPPKVIINHLSKFKFLNIDLINSKIGSLLYFIFMLLSILALNSQQKYLLKINSISTEPVLPKDNGIENKNRYPNQ